jgi:hypothetical protein
MSGRVLLVFLGCLVLAVIAWFVVWQALTGLVWLWGLLAAER